MTSMRKETDSLGVVEVPADKLWGAQTQRSLEHFSIGKDLIPREMITAYATLKKAAAIANHDGKRLDDQRYKLIVQTCDEILAGQHHDMFPLHVWMTGSGTQFNMNVNEVISNRCCQLAGTPLGSHSAGSSQRSRQHGAVVERFVPFGDVHRRGREREGAPHSGGDGAARRDRRESAGVGRHRQDRTHPHAGCHPADIGPGMVRLCRDAVGRSGADRRRRCRACTVWRSAARRSAPASTRRPALPKRRPPRSPSSPACPSSLRPTSSRCRALTMRWSSSPGRCARSRCRSTRSPTTFA